MNLRFYTVYLALLTFTEVATAANNAAWDCEQGKNGEWSCLNQGKTAVPEPSQPAATGKQATPDGAKPVTANPSNPAPAAVASEPTPQPAATATAAKPAEAARAQTQKIRATIAEGQKPVIEQVPVQAEAQAANRAESAPKTAK